MRTIDKSRGFIALYWDIIDDTELTWDEATLLGYLIHVWDAPSIRKRTKVIDGKVYRRFTNAYIAEKTGFCADKIRGIINTLRDAGYLEYQILKIGRGQGGKERWIHLTVDIKDDTNVNMDVDMNGDMDVDMNGKTVNKDIKETKETKEINDKKEDKHSSEIKEIIDYLNQKANTNYKYTSESNNKHIRARLNEGYSIDDFKKVIDVKSQDSWFVDNGFLRPQTLFGNKFENYLNEKPKQNTSGKALPTSLKTTETGVKHIVRKVVDGIPYKSEDEGKTWEVACALDENGKPIVF